MTTLKIPVNKMKTRAMIVYTNEQIQEVVSVTYNSVFTKSTGKEAVKTNENKALADL